MVHPQADEWIVKLVDAICARVGMNFQGKSKLYQLIVKDMQVVKANYIY